MSPAALEVTLYSYKAVNRAGLLQTGELDYPDRDKVVEELLRRGATPLEVQPKSDWIPAWLHRPLSLRRAVGSHDVLGLTQEVATLLRAGLNLDRALSIVSNLTDRKGVRILLKDVLERVRGGSSFAEALEAHPDIFAVHYTSMVRAGELGGSLAEVMTRLASLLDRSQQLKERVRSALIYPCILTVMIVLTLVLVITVVLPRFERLFAETQSVLPWPTRAVLALGDFVSAYGWFVGFAVVAGTFWLVRTLRRPAARAKFDARLLRLRGVGPLLTNLETSRFLRTAGTLLSNGIPVPTAMRVASGVFTNRALLQATANVLKSLKEGQSLTVLLARAEIYPKLAVQLAGVGEETGKLDLMLLEAAEILDREAQTTLERLLALLVPAVTVGMGVLVAALIGAVLVGILSVNELAF